MVSYESWLRDKLSAPVEARPVPHGELHARLFPFQVQIVAWALALGRAAIFAGCGLGKTAMQLEWARWVAAHTGRPVLILAPLAVSQQTIAEGALMGIGVTYVRDASEVATATTWVLISNYERLDALPVEEMGGVVLDESSILKAFMGKTKRALVSRCASVEYRLACTATPAPNDHMEIGNHAEFLGVMQGSDMLTRWFINDTSNFGTYRLKGHAVESFWDWVASWAVCCALPSDIGHSDDGYLLPELRTIPEWVTVDLTEGASEGAFYRSIETSATSIHKEKRRTLADRVARVAELVAAESTESWIVWCETDYESEALARAIPDAVEVRGSDRMEHKERAALWFAEQFNEECRCLRAKNDSSTTEPTTEPTRASGSGRGRNKTRSTLVAESATPTTPSIARSTRRTSRSTSKTIRSSDLPSGSSPTGSLPLTTAGSSMLREEGARSASAAEESLAEGGCTSTTATSLAASEASSARHATSDSAGFTTTRTGSSAPPCTCGALSAGRRRVLISKPSLFGLGMNWQHVARQAFVGATWSYELFYQAVRRSWRFGQRRPVDVHVVMSTTELVMWETLDAKQQAHDSMRAGMTAAMRRAQAQASPRAAYAPSLEMRIPEWLRTEVAA